MTNNTVSGTAAKAACAPRYDRVSVVVPARLHLVFLDPDGGLSGSGRVGLERAWRGRGAPAALDFHADAGGIVEHV